MSKWLAVLGVKAGGVKVHPGVALGAGGSLLVARQCRGAVVGPHSCPCSLLTSQLVMNLSCSTGCCFPCSPWKAGGVEQAGIRVFVLGAEIHVVMDLSVVLASQKTWKSSSV